MYDFDEGSQQLSSQDDYQGPLADSAIRTRTETHYKMQTTSADCDRKRTTTDPPIHARHPQAEYRPQSANKEPQNRSASQDKLDRAKLDHVLPQFYDVVREDDVLKTVFANQFESYDRLREMIRGGQLHSVACRLMKMFIDSEALTDRPSRLFLREESHRLRAYQNNSEPRHLFQVPSSSLNGIMDSRKLVQLGDQARTLGSYHPTNARQLTAGAEFGQKSDLVSKQHQDKNGIGQPVASHKQMDNQRALPTDTRSSDNLAGHKSRNTSAAGSDKNIKNQNVTFKGCDPQHELTYSKSDHGHQSTGALPNLKDLLSKECSNLSLTLGQASVHDSKGALITDKGDGKDEMTVKRGHDQKKPAQNLKKISARDSSGRTPATKVLLTDTTATDSKREGDSDLNIHHKAKIDPALLAKTDGSTIQNYDRELGGPSKEQSAKVKREHLRSKGQSLSKTSELSATEKQENGQSQTGLAGVTFGKRENLTAMMCSPYLQSQATLKTHPASIRGDASLRNLHGGATNSTQERENTLTGKATGFSHESTSGQDASGKITAQVIYDKLNRGTDFDFRKRSSPVKAFEAKNEIRNIGKVSDRRADQEYLNLAQVGDGSFHNSGSHRYAKSGYKGLTTSTDRPTATSSNGAIGTDSQKDRPNRSHSNAGNEGQQVSSLTQQDASSAYLNLQGSSERPRQSRPDVNQNLLQFGGSSHSQKNSKHPLRDAKHNKSGSALSSRESPCHTSTRMMPEGDSPLTTRQMIKSLLREDLSKVCCFHPRATSLTSLQSWLKDLALDLGQQTLHVGLGNQSFRDELRSNACRLRAGQGSRSI